MTSVVFSRGGLAESVHEVAWCATGPGGEVVAAGDATAADLEVFARSALKPLQALPALDAGVCEAFGLGPAHIALACASHGAGEAHLAVARETLAAAGLDEDALGCGPAEARDPAVAAAMRAAGEAPTRLTHNCSGKHALALALCVHAGWPVEGYLEAEHPLQRAIHAAVAAAAGNGARIDRAVDGCGMLAFRLPLAALAAAFGRLDARTASAMRARPELVAYDGALDTELMRAVPGLVAKVGAEGVLAAGLPDGRGLALKVRDGAMRAIDPAGVALVAEALGCDVSAAGLEPLARPAVVNSRGDVVGAGEARL